MAYLRRHWAVVVLVVLPLTELWRVFIFGETIGPFDQIRQMEPWSGPAPTGSWDVLQADGVLQFYVWRDLVLESWSRLRPPFWNPYQLCGTPLLANSQSGGLYPAHVVMGLLQCPTPVAVGLLAWFHLAWAGLGARWLTRRLGGSEQGALLAGCSFGLSAFMLAWTPLASVVTTVSWIPWCLGSVVPRPGEPYVRRGALLALSTGMMFLAGHLQFAVYGLLGVAALAATLAIGCRDLRVLAVVGFAAIGVAVAAPQVFPTLEFSRASHRAVEPTPEGWAAYSQSAVRPFELAGIVFPGATGLPGRPVAVEGSVVPGYWPAYVKRGANFAEAAVSLGPSVFVLLGLLAWRRGTRGAAGPLVLAAVGALLAFGPLSFVLYFGLPGWSSTGSPGRALVLVVLGLCVAAGLAARHREEPPSARLLAWSALSAVGLTFALAAPGILAQEPWVGGQFPIGRVAMAAWQVAAPGALASLGLAVFGVCALHRRRGLGLASCIAAQWIGLAGLVPTGQPLERPTGLDGAERRAFANAQWGLLAPAPALMPPNTASLFRARDAAGYDSLIDRGTVRLLTEANRQDPAPPANGNMMFVRPGADLERLAELGVTELWVRLSSGGASVIRVPGPGRFSSTGGAVRVVTDEPGRIVVDCEGPGTLTVRERALPGWRIERGGKLLKAKGGPWLEVGLHSGPNRVVFVYTPPGFWPGVTAFLLGAAAVAGCFSWPVLTRLFTGARGKGARGVVP